MQPDIYQTATSPEIVFLAPLTLAATDVFGRMSIEEFHATTRQVISDLYFDTAKLDLIRFGAILRFRASTPQNFWNLQLFTRKGDDYKIRCDLAYEGLPTEIPEELINVLCVFQRSRRLLQIGQIRVVEQRYELCETDGTVYQEVVDRVIASSGALWDAQRYREYSTQERNNSGRARRQSQTFAAVATDQGARHVAFAPEIVRVLGSSLPPTFEILESRVTASSSVYLIFQRAIALSALRLLRFDPQVRLSSDPEMVHELRVGVRRLRSDLRSFSTGLQPVRADALRAELSWLGGEIGRVRDCDVMTSHVLALSRLSIDEDESAIALLKSFLEDRCNMNRTALVAVLNSDRYVNLINEIINVASGVSSIEGTPEAHKGGPQTRSSKHAIANIVRRRWRKYASAADRISRDSSDQELHRVRILAKRCRYAVESALPLFGDSAKKFSGALAEVQDLLGKYHDCVVHETWLRGFAADLPEARVIIGELIVLMRQERNQIRSEWPELLERTSTPKLRRWMQN